jgi:CheY-like chemotaxis protein
MARILLADDDAATRALVQRALAVDGHDVTSTQDGAEALERLQAAGRFDLLISDVQMPAVDGIALAEKGLAVQPGLKVILISGFADELDRAAHLKKRKIAHMVAKPITLEGIRAAVKAALG